MATGTVIHDGDPGISKTPDVLENLSIDLSLDFSYIQELCSILSDGQQFMGNPNKVEALADAISLIAERAESKIEAAMEAHHA